MYAIIPLTPREQHVFYEYHSRPAPSIFHSKEEKAYFIMNDAELTMAIFQKFPAPFPDADTFVLL